MKTQNIFSDFYLFLFIVLLLFLGSPSSYAQEKDTIHSIIEEGWIEKMNTKIAMDVSLNNSFEIFEVKTPTNKYILYPNTPTNLRLNLSYRFISLGFQFSPSFIPGNNDDDLKGKTKSIDLRTSLIFKHLFFDLSYSKVKGYYLKNSADYLTSFSKGDPYIQFPDLNYNGFSITSGYSSNSKFLIRSLRNQTKRQLKSAGSFMPVFNFRYYKINDKSSDINTQFSTNIETSIGPGYGHTFVLNKCFYFTLSVQGSLGYLNTKLTTRQALNDIVTKQDNFIFRWDGKSGIGYNGDTFYTGIYTTISDTHYKQQNTTVANHDIRIFYNFFLGIRIKSPKYLNRKFPNIH